MQPKWKLVQFIDVLIMYMHACIPAWKYKTDFKYNFMYYVYIVTIV